MSRYALEWAKRQGDLDSIAKLALVLLADDAEGRDHKGRINLHELAKLIPSTVDGAESALDRLTSGQLAKYETSASPGGLTRVTYELLVPSNWGASFGGKRPSRTVGRVEEPTAVYRFYDEDGVLLYVGIANGPSGRFDQHAKTKAWWLDVRTREITWYEDRRAAEVEEDRAIIVEQPKYNVRGSATTCAGASRVRYVFKDSRQAKAHQLAERIINDIQAGEFDDCPVPEAQDLALRYSVDAVLAEQAGKILVRGGYVHLGFNRLVLGSGVWSWRR